ncbi:MAG: hypothetical protein KDA91_10725 [Planctomycetaceae bacterium]|nr:hypothetical protein [Planctomycetaceae bacterium]
MSESTTRPGWLRVLGGHQVFLVWLLFVFCSLAQSFIPGVNEPHYLCKARSFADPSWCERDFFLASHNSHFCFYVIVGPLTKVMPFWLVALFGRFVSLALVAWGWCRLAQTLRLRAAFVFGSSALYAVVASLGSFSGEWILGGFESKVPAWGLFLLAAARWMTCLQKGSYRDAVFAGIYAGLATALHPVVGIWGVTAFGMVQFTGCFLPVRGLNDSTQDVEKCVPTESRPWLVLPASVPQTAFSSRVSAFAADSTLMLLPYSVISLAGVVPALRLLIETNVDPDDKAIAEFIQVFWRLSHHMDPSAFSVSQWAFAALVCSALVYLRWLRQVQRRRAETTPATTTVTTRPTCEASMQILERLLVASGMIALAGIAIGWHTVPAKELGGWEWRAALLKFYPFRLFDGMMPILVALSIAVWLQNRFTLQLSSAEATARLQRLNRLKAGRAIAGIISIAVLFNLRSVAPAGYTIRQYLDWRDVCFWIREHTPPESLILTPRESFAFKWLAQRAEFVTYKDCPQDASGILEWNRRLWYLNGWTYRSSLDGLYDHQDMQSLRSQTDCDYVVTRTFGPFEQQPVFAAGEWGVYEVPR